MYEVIGMGWTRTWVDHIDVKTTTNEQTNKMLRDHTVPETPRC